MVSSYCDTTFGKERAAIGAERSEALQEGRSSMATVLKISEAASLALHTMVLPGGPARAAADDQGDRGDVQGVRGAPGEGAPAAGEGRVGAFRAGASRRFPSPRRRRADDAAAGLRGDRRSVGLGPLPPWRAGVRRKEVRSRAAGLQPERAGQETLVQDAAERRQGRFRRIRSGMT